jgi:hypothetical protein
MGILLRLLMKLSPKQMTKTAWAWVWFGLLLALDITIPWYVLTSVEKMSAAFLFWTIWALVAIASAFFILLRWKGVKS